jgi:D-alanyl-D-alanine carboxypeptidase/D-alanyl-D-alanine-endopeptidase (penicillin-binding protein 4)
MATGPMKAFRAAMLALALGGALPSIAQQGPGQPTLQARVESRLREAGPGTRFGLVVATQDGRELVAIAPDARFIPASNTKMFVTAAAFATFSGLDRPDHAGGAAVRLERAGGAVPDVVLEGHGDARLSSAPGCRANCLATLADAVAARTRLVRDIIGDDGLFPDQRWSPGMSWNNIGTRSGTAVSALSLDDNELVLRVAPTAPGRPPALDLPAYLTVDNQAATAAGGATNLDFERLPGSNVLRLTGTIAVGAEPQLLRLGIDDPAHYAAWRFKALLEARGVRVAGAVSARHRSGGPLPPQEPLARLVPPPLGEDLTIINKASQNLHAELMLRRLGRINGIGSIADGLALVRAMLERAGLRRADYDFSDGSGMSTYNRVAPRGVVRFLRWAGAQPWGAAWRATLPIAGVDGTLARRFRGTALEARLFAKTGGLNATAALSGYMIARSGRTLIFSIYANDIPDGAGATAAMDAALVLIAEQN